MSAFEGLNLNKLQKRRDENIGYAPEGPDGLTLNELARQDGSAFQEYLDSLPANAKSLMERYLNNGTIVQTDNEKLIDLRKEYLSRKRSFESLFAVHKEYTGGMLRHSKELSDLTNLYGDQTIQATLEQGLRKIALTEPGRFAGIAAEYGKLKQFEETIEKPFNQRLANWCDRNNIPPDDKRIEAALLEQNSYEREKLLRRRLTEHMGFRARFIDAFKSGFGYGTEAQAKKLAGENVNAIIGQRDQLTKDMGDYVRTLLNDNKDLRGLLAQKNNGTESIPERMTMDDASAVEVPNDAADKFAEYLSDNRESFGGKASYEELSAAEQRQGLNGFAKEYEKLVFKDRKGGFWAAVARLLFGQRLKKEIQEKYSKK